MVVAPKPSLFPLVEWAESGVPLATKSDSTSLNDETHVIRQREIAVRAVNQTKITQPQSWLYHVLLKQPNVAKKMFTVHSFQAREIQPYSLEYHSN